MSILPIARHFLVLVFIALSARAQCTDWSPAFDIPGHGIVGSPNTMIVFDDGTGPKLLVGGVSQAGGANVGIIAAWNGTNWSSFDSLGPDAYVRAFAVFDDGTGQALYAGGSQFVIAGVPFRTIAKWVPGSGWSAFADQPNSSVSCLATLDLGAGPALYVGGGFTSVGATSAARIARWDGTNWAALGAGLNEEVLTLATFDDGTGSALFAGGYFTHSASTHVSYLAGWNGTDWQMPSAGPITSVVHALEPFDDGSGLRLFIGAAQGPIQKLGPAGYTATSGTSMLARDFHPYDDGNGLRLYAAGDMVYPGLEPRGGIVAWDGSTWQQLGLGILSVGSEKPRALTTYTDSAGPGLYVTGNMQNAGGHPSLDIARWGLPCSAPTIVAQPSSATATFAVPVSFQITAHGTGPLAYQWKHEGVPITGGFGVTGWNTRTLTLAAWGWDSRGTYECEVMGALGSVTSDLVTLTVPAGGSTGSPVQLTCLAMQGDPVPGLPGVTFGNVATADQSVDGTVVIGADASDFTHGRYVYDGVSVTRALVNGDAAPGLAPGITFATANNVFGAADQGAFCCIATVTGPGINGDNERGIWYRDANGLSLVARAGDSPAGWSPAGEVFTSNSFWPRTGASGDVVYTSIVRSGNTFVGQGVWGWTAAGGSTLWTRIGSLAPGTTETYTAFEQLGIVNASGQTPLVGLTALRRGVWLAGHNLLVPAILTGEPLAGSTNNEVITSIVQSVPVINDVGQIATSVATSGDAGYLGKALVRWGSSGIETILRAGDPAPGAIAPAAFVQFEAIGLNNDGGILVWATFTTAGNGPYVGYWYVTPQGSVLPVALGVGQTLPEVPPSFVFWRYDIAALDGAGRVLVTAEYTNGNKAVFGWTEATGLFPVAVPGGLFEVAPGDAHILASANMHMFDGSVTAVKQSSSFDGNGGVSLRLRFTDEPGGIFVARFSQLYALYNAPGTIYCAGDGTGAACPCGNAGMIDHGCASSLFPGGARLDGTGAASLSDDTLQLEASALPNSSCLFFQGTAEVAGGAGALFGDGLRCVGGSVLRLGLRAVSGNAQGLGHGVGSDAPISTTGQVVAPGTRRYQAWYRNAAAFCTPSTFNLTNGLEVEWGV